MTDCRLLFMAREEAAGPMLIEAVGNFMGENYLTEPGQKVLVAVSGGADSVAMLAVLVELRERLGISLHVAHLDHMLRGTESAADAEFVVSLASGFGLPITVGHRDVKSFVEEERLSIEDAARQIRYHFLAETATKEGAGLIAVGHTKDDQAETVLLHLVRGSGLNGLAAMRPKGNLPFPEGGASLLIRPLLNVSRSETIAYCREQRLPWRNDPSNDDPSFSRNRIRAAVLPVLRQINPGVSDSLSRLANSVADDLAFLDLEANQHLSAIATVHDGEVLLENGALLSLPRALRRRIFRSAISRVRHSLADICLVHIDDMLKAVSRGAGTEVHLPGGLRFRVEYGQSRLFLAPPDGPPRRERLIDGDVCVPGESRVGPWLIRSSLRSAEQVGHELPQGWVAEFDYAHIQGGISVRGRRPGDRFVPLGMHHLKKLQDFMVDEKIPRHLRDSVPIVVDAGGPIWIVGWRIDERVKVTPATRTVLKLEFSRLPEGNLTDSQS